MTMAPYKYVNFDLGWVYNFGPSYVLRKFYEIHFIILDLLPLCSTCADPAFKFSAKSDTFIVLGIFSIQILSQVCYLQYLRLSILSQIFYFQGLTCI